MEFRTLREYAKLEGIHQDHQVQLLALWEECNAPAAELLPLEVLCSHTCGCGQLPFPLLKWQALTWAVESQVCSLLCTVQCLTPVSCWCASAACFNCWQWLRPSATSLPSQHCLWHSLVLVSSSYEVTPPQLLLDDAFALWDPSVQLLKGSSLLIFLGAPFWFDPVKTFSFSTPFLSVKAEFSLMPQFSTHCWVLPA